MITDPRIRKRRIDKLISRFGGGTSQTSSWPQLKEAARAVISEAMLFPPQEEPLVAFFSSVSCWCVATTERFAWHDGREIMSLAWHDLADASLTEQEWNEVSHGRTSKDALDALTLRTTDGHHYKLFLEPGDGFSLMWSVLVALSSGG